MGRIVQSIQHNSKLYYYKMKKISKPICMWCGQGTSGNKDEEHIFPECIGGKIKLRPTYVCKKCNEKLSLLDEALKREHFSMMRAFQIDRNIFGKHKNSAHKKRKEKEKFDINGKFSAKDTRLINQGNNSNFINVSHVVTAPNFVRSLHKCAANILCNKYGPEYVRHNHKELLEFVKKGSGIRPWSYAVSYPHIFFNPLISQPQTILIKAIDQDNKSNLVISFAHTSGIWLLGTKPFLLNSDLITKCSDEIHDLLSGLVKIDNGKPITDFFGFDWLDGKRTLLGKLKFLWVIEEKAGKPNKNLLYLLTKCKVCGQTVPTGITLDREIIYKEKNPDPLVSRCVHYDKNTWNNYTFLDLKNQGMNINKDNKSKFTNLLHRGFTIPEENDVKKLKISNGQCPCLNCGNQVNFNATDCFI